LQLACFFEGGGGGGGGGGGAVTTVACAINVLSKHPEVKQSEGLGTPNNV